MIDPIWKFLSFQRGYDVSVGIQWGFLGLIPTLILAVGFPLPGTTSTRFVGELGSIAPGGAHRSPSGRAHLYAGSSLWPLRRAASAKNVCVCFCKCPSNTRTDQQLKGRQVSAQSSRWNLHPPSRADGEYIADSDFQAGSSNVYKGKK